ncbi:MULTISPECIES: cytochrome c maturation protein CcmE [Prauserella]|uniref:Cytochrome C biogenesis protein n=2 Tax=Prauserella TaxID=142577 RepID=A0A318LCH5_9PSEU|nr:MULTISPECIES: cytochrome c maturation protein CcmE [Prauserella]PXY17554.1 cytochrome C biogenesis protein [Prauserella flavalba]PXY18603.1 cytochrome C biogenesis protein [Prauserella coralliicola]TKG63535.1 cytochrome c maturation protein CcmE [Prauserella endophytica]
MKRYRLLAFSGVGVVAILAGVLLFGNLNENLVYYLTPQEALAQRVEFPDGRRFQLGGFVEKDTVVRTQDGLRFAVASGVEPGSPSITVEHHGAPAQLFQAGIGVVLEGSWQGDEFVSDTMKVKHDENYQPPDTEGGAQ